MKFVKSAVKPEHYPNPDRPEIALAGRSNAGKSSFINALAGSRVAKVSGQPGKTRLLNFFDFGPSYRFVDMPGYGYSARSGNEQRSWQEMIEGYLSLRANFTGLVLVMDIRREWTQDEEVLWRWVQGIHRPMLVVLNKADKLSKNQMLNKVFKMKKLKPEIDFFAVSSVKRTNLKEVEDFIYENWVEPIKESQ